MKMVSTHRPTIRPRRNEFHTEARRRGDAETMQFEQKVTKETKKGRKQGNRGGQRAAYAE